MRGSLRVGGDRMKRPCPHADGPTEPKTCRVCYLFENDAGFRKLLGGSPLPEHPCRHRGEEVGLELCPSCKGHVEVKLFSCKIHGKCSTHKKLEATACCRGCHDGPVVVWSNANGVGDALLGLCAVAALKGIKPHREVIYRVSQPHQYDWVSLFTGYDKLVTTDVKTVTGRELPIHFLPEEAKDTTLRTSRWEHYAKAIGAPCAVVPPARPMSKEAREAALPYRGAVVMSPYSCYPDRAWQPHLWVELESQLLAAGQKCVVLDGFSKEASKIEGPGFQSPVLGYGPALVAAVLQGAALFIGNDSGMSHAAGMFRTRALVVSWYYPGDQTYGLYGNTTTMQAKAWRDSITVDMVLAKSLELIGKK